MECKNCGAANEADAKTCRQCGQNLQGDAPARSLTPEEHIRIGELIYASYKHKESGAIEDAILACQGALALNDASPAAHVLLASLYELKGDIAAAIYEYERAVELDPGNLTNRQKLDELKSAPVTLPQSKPSAVGWVEQVSTYAPYAAFGAVFVVVLLALSMILGRSSAGRPGDQSAGTAAPQGTVPQMTAPIRPYAQPQYPRGQYYPQPYAGQMRAQQRPPTPGAPALPSQASRPRPVAPQTPPASSGSQAGSRATPGSQPPAPKEPPVIVPVIEPSRVPAQPQPRPGATIAPAPKPTQPASPPVQPAADPEQRAVQLQRAGKYQDAIAAYREALNRTSDTGRIHQQIALCYQRVGQYDAAIDSYNRAIRSYRDQLAAGRDPTEVQKAIRSCEAGIGVSRSQGR